MKILAVECSAAPASCAVSGDGGIIASSFINVRLTHSQTLVPMIEAMLNAADIRLCDIGGFAVSAGPGSFTGIRIGISAVKGLAAAHGVPCCPVSTLLAMAYRLRYMNTVVCAVMDARCHQVYNALFRCENGVVSRLCDDRAVMAEQLAEEVRALPHRYGLPVTVIGDGAQMFFEYVSGCDGIVLADGLIRYQHAEGVCAAACELFAAGRTTTPAQLLPFYLRLPQAERELNKRKGL